MRYILLALLLMSLSIIVPAADAQEAQTFGFISVDVPDGCQVYEPGEYSIVRKPFSNHVVVIVCGLPSPTWNIFFWLFTPQDNPLELAPEVFFRDALADVIHNNEGMSQHEDAALDSLTINGSSISLQSLVLRRYEQETILYAGLLTLPDDHAGLILFSEPPDNSTALVEQVLSGITIRDPLTAEPDWVVRSLEDGPRGCPDNCTLRHAVMSAQPNDIIGFAPDLTGTITLLAPLAVDKPLSIVGPGADQLTIQGLSGEWAERLFLARLTAQDSSIDAGNLILDAVISQNSQWGMLNGFVSSGQFVNSKMVITGIGGHWGDAVHTVIVGSTFIDQSDTALTINGDEPLVTVANSTFTRNGTAIALDTSRNWGGRITISYTTIADNMTGILQNDEGYRYGYYGYPVVLNDSIVAGNQTDTVDVRLTSSGSNIIGSVPSDRRQEFPFDQIGADPLLLELGDYGGSTPTIALSPDSPAVNRGGGTTCPATDQRGIPRTVPCDIGAFEIESDSAAVTPPAQPDDSGFDWVVRSLEDGPRGCPDNCTLRHALTLAQFGDTIGFAEDLTGTITLRAPLDISTSINIVGPGADRIAIDAQRQQMFTLEEKNLSILISGLTLQNAVNRYGDGSTQPGGVLDTGDFGSGYASSLILDDVTLRDNDQPIDIGPVSTVTIRNSRFIGNSGDYVIRIVAERNKVLTVSITNSLFMDNAGAAVVGIAGYLLSFSAAEQNDIIVTNSTFTRNGTAISAYSIPMTVSYSTIVGNGVGVSGPVTLNDSIVAFNEQDIDAATGGSMISSGTNIIGIVPDELNSIFVFDQIDVDPLLLQLSDYGGPTYTFALSPDSPAIDAGGGTTCPATDQRGTPRTAPCDAGAYEFDGEVNGLAYGLPMNCAFQTDVSQTECEALVALYNSTGGPNWRNNTGWNATQTLCTWFGVTCEAGAITQLSLSDLIGDIPPEIGQLTNLTELYLSGDQITALPPEIGQLTNLTALSLSRNQITTLPPEIGQLTNLTALSLSRNQITTLPPEIGRLTNLTYLDLFGNRLTTLPVEITSLNSLQRLDLRNNCLALEDSALITFLDAIESEWTDQSAGCAAPTTTPTLPTATLDPAAGEDCSLVRIDNGDGTFSEREECVSPEAPTATPDPTATVDAALQPPTETPAPTSIPSTQQLQPGSYSGQIRAGGTQTWTYDGQAGELLTLTAEADWDTTLLLLLNGEAIAANDDYFGTNSRIQLILPSDGTYEITVAGYDSSASGPYTLSIESGVADEANIGINRGAISPGGVGIWAYVGQAGESLTLTTDADWDTTLSLRLNGEEIAYNDDFSGTNSRIQLVLPSDGTYEITVAGYDSSASGPYTLSIESSGRTIIAASPTVAVLATETPDSIATVTPVPTATTAVAVMPPTATPDAIATAIAGTVAALQPTATLTETPDAIATAVAATVAALQAPAASPTPTETPDVVATGVAATVAALQAPTTANEIFRDSFDDNRNNWETANDADEFSDVVDGSYVVDFRRSDASWWVMAGWQNYALAPVMTQPYEAEIRFTITENLTQNPGVGFVYNLTEGYTDGFWLALLANGEWVHRQWSGDILSSGQSDVTITIGQTYTLRLQVTENTVSFYLDDSLITSIRNSDGIHDTAGFGVVNGSSGSVRVEFDDFVIHNLE